MERRIGGHRVRVECAEAYEAMATNVLDVLERLAADEAPLRAGTEVRFGWTALRLVDDDGALRVAEPNFANWPRGGWVPRIDTSLEVVAAQVGLLHRLDVDGEDVWFDQFLTATRGALERPGVFLRRGNRISAEDSGWLLGALEDPEALTRGDDLEAVLVASLVPQRLALLQGLTLPTGFIVVFSDETIEQVLDAAGRELLPSGGPPAV
jgi:hypothetical protein